MKKIMTAILGMALFSVSMTSFAQSPLKIGHVNINEIMAALPERDSAQVILERETKEIETTFGEMTVVYNKLFDEYQKGLPNYSELVRKTKESELLDKQKRLAEFEENASVTLQNRNAELIKPIYDKIIKAVERIATENGFTYVLNVSSGSVVFTSKESHNLDPLVLKLLKP